MLSDVGSKVIRAFGILTTNVPEDHKMMYGIPWPGDYLIGPDRTVLDKLFLLSYQHRPAASAVVLRNFGVDAGANSVVIETDVLTATVSLSADRCFPRQELGVAVLVQPKAVWHILWPAPTGKLPAHDLTFESALID
jgi:hypothetical protein